MSHAKYMTRQQLRNLRAEERRRPATMAELVEVHDTMRAVLGPNPEAMDPQARAIYLLDESRIRAAGKENRS